MGKRHGPGTVIYEDGSFKHVAYYMGEKDQTQWPDHAKEEFKIDEKIKDVQPKMINSEYLVRSRGRRGSKNVSVGGKGRYDERRRRTRGWIEEHSSRKGCLFNGPAGPNDEYDAPPRRRKDSYYDEDSDFRGIQEYLEDQKRDYYFRESGGKDKNRTPKRKRRKRSRARRSGQWAAPQKGGFGREIDTNNYQMDYYEERYDLCKCCGKMKQPCQANYPPPPSGNRRHKGPPPPPPIPMSPNRRGRNYTPDRMMMPPHLSPIRRPAGSPMMMLPNSSPGRMAALSPCRMPPLSPGRMPRAISPGRLQQASPVRMTPHHRERRQSIMGPSPSPVRVVMIQEPPVQDRRERESRSKSRPRRRTSIGRNYPPAYPEPYRDRRESVSKGVPAHHPQPLHRPPQPPQHVEKLPAKKILLYQRLGQKPLAGGTAPYPLVSGVGTEPERKTPPRKASKRVKIIESRELEGLNLMERESSIIHKKTPIKRIVTREKSPFKLTVVVPLKDKDLVRCGGAYDDVVAVRRLPKQE